MEYSYNIIFVLLVIQIELILLNYRQRSATERRLPGPFKKRFFLPASNRTGAVIIRARTVIRRNAVKRCRTTIAFIDRQPGICGM